MLKYHLTRNNKSGLEHWEYYQTPEFAETLPAELWADTDRKRRGYGGVDNTYHMLANYVRKGASKWFEGGNVTLAPDLHKYIQENMITDCGIYLEIIQTNCGSYRLFAKHDQIIGSRLLADLDNDAAEEYVKAHERKEAA